MSTSLPALLGNYLSTKHMWVVTADSVIFENGPCGMDYQVSSELNEELYVGSLAGVISRLAQRLDAARMCLRNGSLDLPQQLGLSESQANACQQTRHNNVSYLRVYSDLFVPEFRHAERYWATTFFRTYHNAYPNPVLIDKWNRHFGGRLQLVEREGKRCLLTGQEEVVCEEWEERLLRVVGPEMRERLQRAHAVIEGVEERLRGQGMESFVRFSAAEEERRVQSVRRDLQVSLEDLFQSFDDFRDPRLAEKLSTCPTLTMEAVFEVG